MAKKANKPARVEAAGGRKQAKRHIVPKIALDPLDTDYSRADLIFEGVDHSGASFEARVFLNNESANDQTPATPENGYAGSFHIFGHGGCFGDDITHCQIRGAPRPYDPRPAHP